MAKTNSSGGGTRPCIIDGCEETVSDRSVLDVCKNCRGNDYRWSKRRPAEILERRKNLTKYQSRMEHLDSPVGRNRYVAVGATQNARGENVRAFKKRPTTSQPRKDKVA